MQLAVDIREQTIQQLMNHDIPRWKAEQMAVSPQRFKQIQEGGNGIRYRRLHEKLHGAGPVGQAFKRLCNAGCDAAWLERTVCSLYHYPQTQKWRAFNASDRRRLQRIAGNLEHVGRDLARFQSMILLSRITEWPVPQGEVASIVEGIGYCLKQVTTSPTSGLTIATARFRILHVIAQIKRSTGRPHYADMATLIGAAYGRPDYSEGELKMLVARTRTARRSK
jgi:hypothetical protein